MNYQTQQLLGATVAMMVIAVGFGTMRPLVPQAGPIVTLYHETFLKPEIIWREGLRPPRPDYTLNFLSRQLGIPLSTVDAEWIRTAAEDSLFYDYLYGPEPGVSKRVRKNLFFWMYKPTPYQGAGALPLELEKFALEMVRNSSVHMSPEEVRGKLFTSTPSIVTVRIPGSWLWGAKPGFVEWLTSAQAAGEKVDIEIEVGRLIPPKYILSVEEAG